MNAQADAPTAPEGRRPSRAVALLFGALLSGLFSQAQAAPVGDSLDRPALATRLGTASVLLAAAQAGPTTVAVGERGLVLLSADPARSWRQAQVLQQADLARV